MSHPQSTPRLPILERLQAGTRRANHLVAAGVLVFAASILLGSVLSRPLLALAHWATVHLGHTGLVLLGPLVLDGPKAIVLLAVGFPLGRILLLRPWVGSGALLGIVYGLWFCFDYAVGAAGALYGRWEPLVGRGVFAALVLWGTARAMAWGRRVALRTDLPAAARSAGGHAGAGHDAPPARAESGEHEESDAPSPGVEQSERGNQGERGSSSRGCKPAPASDVERGST